jgi:biopolymer transport protein ExbD
MFDTLRRRRAAGPPLAVDIAPLIDIMFILLIFFLVSASFVPDAGIAVRRPEAAHASALPPESLRVSIAASGGVYVDAQAVELPVLTARAEAFLSREPEGAVVLIPDETLSAGRLVAVMDSVRAAGVSNIVVAARPRERQP